MTVAVEILTVWIQDYKNIFLFKYKFVIGRIAREGVRLVECPKASAYIKEIGTCLKFFEVCVRNASAGVKDAQKVLI